MSEAGGINQIWSNSERGKRVTLRRRQIFDRSSRLVLLGSCFAMEIKNYLNEEGFNAAPDFRGLTIDESTQNLDKLREYNHINHFDTFSMRQEFELAFGERARRLDECMVSHAGGTKGLFGDTPTVEDCYRPYTYAKSPEALFEVASRIDGLYRSAIKEADVIVCTFGLTEVWRRNHTDLVSSVYQRDSRFECSSFEDNVANIRRIVGLIRHNLPKAELVVTVSPVPLVRTMADEDVIVANMESKAILRAAVGAVCREDRRITYFPSFEIALAHDVFEEDGRHVKKVWTRRIFRAFAESCGAEIARTQA